MKGGVNVELVNWFSGLGIYYGWVPSVIWMR